MFRTYRIPQTSFLDLRSQAAKLNCIKSRREGSAHPKVWTISYNATTVLGELGNHSAGFVFFPFSGTRIRAQYFW